jgi:hypothetical protein
MAVCVESGTVDHCWDSIAWDTPIWMNCQLSLNCHLFCSKARSLFTVWRVRINKSRQCWGEQKSNRLLTHIRAEFRSGTGPWSWSFCWLTLFWPSGPLLWRKSPTSHGDLPSDGWMLRCLWCRCCLLMFYQDSPRTPGLIGLVAVDSRHRQFNLRFGSIRWWIQSCTNCAMRSCFSCFFAQRVIFNAHS